MKLKGFYKIPEIGTAQGTLNPISCEVWGLSEREVCVRVCQRERESEKARMGQRKTLRATVSLMSSGNGQARRRGEFLTDRLGSMPACTVVYYIQALATYWGL
jgi:hypothetical protein